MMPTDAGRCRCRVSSGQALIEALIGVSALGLLGASAVMVGKFGLLQQAIANLSRRYVLTIATSKRRAVDGEHHLQRRLIDRQPRQRTRILHIANGVANLDLAESNQGDDVACLSTLELDTLVGVHFHDTADALGLAGEGVQHGHAFLDLTRVYPGEGERAVLVVHDLERERT